MITVQQGADGKPKRNPYCSRCRNHGKIAQVKGHKRHCEYRDCQCEGCKLVECRQIVSAAQIKRRRYQKQDEECGRRIEISPPVLKREPNSDPAALIARTLIGSGGNKHIPQHAVHKQLGSHQTDSSTHQHLSSIHSSAAAASLAAAAAAVSSASTSLSLPDHLHNHLSGSMAAGSTNNHQHSNQLLGSSSLSLDMNHHPPGQQIGPDGSASQANSALSNALRLFHFPNSLLSTAAALNSQSVAIPTGSGAMMSSSRLAASTLLSSSSSPFDTSTPGLFDQINLVEEIHQVFGPLAIYAWLRAENFDLQKIRNLIEISRISFDELLLETGHSPLDLTSPIVD